jgi:hypothetical protein
MMRKESKGVVSVRAPRWEVGFGKKTEPKVPKMGNSVLCVKSLVCVCVCACGPRTHLKAHGCKNERSRVLR